MAGRRPTATRKCRGKEAGGNRRPALRANGMDETRQRLSREAARIMAEEGVHDFHSAKRKAADRLNLPEARNLPSNQEVEQALAEHLRLFHAQQLPQTLQRLRCLAVEAMRFLERFQPRLVGSLLTGHVTRFSEIQLHVTADAPEEVAFFLREQAIPYEETVKRLRYGGNRSELVPVYKFQAEDTTIELSIFSVAAVREAPLSPVDGRPMKRSGLKEIEAVLETT